MTNALTKHDKCPQHEGAQECPWIDTRARVAWAQETVPGQLTMLEMLATTVPGWPMSPALYSSWVSRKGPMVLVCKAGREGSMPNS